MNIPVVVVATFYSGMPPRADRRRHHLSPGAILHLRQRHRSHRIAIADWRQHHSRLFPIEHQRRYRRGDHRQPRRFRHEGSAARHSAAGRAQIRRVQPSGLPGHDERRRHERRQSERHRAEFRPQPVGERARRVDSSAVRRTVAADSILRGPDKLEARQISPMDVVRSLSQANVILPAGDVQIGNLDYNIYSNAQFDLKDAGPVSRSR